MRHLLVFTLILTSFYLQGQSGKALYLDGQGDFMTVNHHEDFNLDIGESTTITCRVKCSSATDFFRILSKRGGTTGSAPGYELIVKSGTGEFGINLRSTSGVNAGPPFGVKPVCNGEWHHLAMVVDAVNGKSAI